VAESKRDLAVLAGRHAVECRALQAVCLDPIDRPREDVAVILVKTRDKAAADLDSVVMQQGNSARNRRWLVFSCELG
jgi:hypothetical protein